MVDPSSGPENATPPLCPADKEILVVDDDAAVRDAVGEILEEEGYQVRTALHGQDAIVHLTAGPPPDLILLDLLMPVMDGWAFMAELKSRAHLAGIPVIVTTAAGTNVLHSAPVCAGYLAKPLGRSLLLETVARCLSRAPPRGGPGP